MTGQPGADPPPWPASFWARVWIYAKGAWWTLTDIGRVFWACRAPLLAVAIGGGLIAFTDQARDIVVAEAAADSGLLQRISAALFVAIWALSSWYWARTTLNSVFALDAVWSNAIAWSELTARERAYRAARRDYVADQVPRVIGSTAIASLGIGFGNAADAYEAAGAAGQAHVFVWWSWVYAALAVLFYVAMAIRRAKTRDWFGDAGKLSRLFVAERTSYREFSDYYRDNPFTAVVLGVSLALSPLLTLCFIINPVAVSASLGGAVNAVLFGLALLVPVFSVLALIARHSGLPLFAGVVLWMAVAPWLFADNHDVRIDPTATSGAALDGRRTLGEAFVRWWDVNARPDVTRPIGAVSDGGNPVVAPPFVVVATAGGASRAAFWTSQVLGEIAAREPYFTDRVFMVSGVSGGSLGATVFRSIVEADRRAAAGHEPPTLNDPAGRARAFIEQDFLGPAMAAGLYVDLPFRTLSFLPRAWLPDDRAAALEKAWEAAWRTTIGKGGTPGFAWSDGFLTTFAAGDRPWPILALNGTSVEKGKRIVTSNAHFGASDLSGPLIRYDGFDIFGRDIRISTAVTMSARFPVISPAGGMRDANGKLYTRVIDGGLFENFGAATADEVLRYVVERRGDVQLGLKPVVPLAILISSDPSLDHLDDRTGTGYRVPPVGTLAPTPDCAPVTGPPPELTPVPRAHPGNSWPECPIDGRQSASVIGDPVLALYDGRVARGEQAATALLERIFENRVTVRDRLAQQLARATGRDARYVDPQTAPDATVASLRDGWWDAYREVVTRLGTRDHTDFFHFRQCRVPGAKGPTMSWHDSREAWQAMRTMTGLEAGRGDPCGNAAEFFRLCVRLARLSGEAGDDKAATELCETQRKWPRPAAWTCREVSVGDDRRWYCHLGGG